MEHSYRIDGKPHAITLQKKGDGFVAVIGDHEHVVRDVSVSNGTICFTIDRRTHRIFASHDRRGSQLHFEGRNFLIESEDADDDGHAGHHQGGDGSVEAPMPGSIVSVNVSVGDSVESGGPLVVLESMKMQNEISSPVTGKVTAINCKTGDQVGFGDVLVEIEAG